MPKIEPEFLVAIRDLRTFSRNIDLQALALTVDDPLQLIEQLIRSGNVNKTEICRLWAGQVNHSYVDPFTTIVTPEALAAIPAEIATKANALPLYVLNGVLTVAMAHPEDAALVRRLGMVAQMEVSPAFAPPSEIADLVRIHYATEESLAEACQLAEAQELLKDDVEFSAGGAQLKAIAENEQIIEFVNALIYFAINKDASDIHIEPQETEVTVRYRIDGSLRPLLTIPRALHPAVTIRLKVMADCDITESRMPADGRFSIPVGASSADFRFSSIPSQYGEKSVIRLLGNTSLRTMLSLDKMMISQSILQPYRRVMKSPSGIIFVTGPTGSGKTTTLYATLAELNQPDVNISTIEDPIELKLESINQTQVNHTIDLSFARMLRALLRQDPDILLVGEIRDLETAKIATEAALTGHLVLTTLHVKSAPEVFVRLQEMGVDNYLIAPSVLAVAGQRLVPRICERCKESYEPEEAVLRRYFDDEELPEKVLFHRGRGCPHCDHTGFKGRVAFHELLVVNRELRGLIANRANLEDITQAARKVGYRPLRYDGLKKVLLGLTTIEEVEAATPLEYVS
ncbi:GspE/PulE family protein [Actomonas aquatica]|uniref:GspE/PulE family protein n=1 Tax=Actomonas aquatica TaxID=2866162 RepID=A0ABZ1C1W7_9BACT|nr:GspE/PulE family protein [Opitutus sp. WL0086]WRQ85648.1 GspE/PulE family protein [Opitutus sp. WL0086]